jgi:hypothetical protein
VLIQGDDDHTVVMNLDERRWLSIDHTSRTYLTFSFDELAEMSQEMMASIQEASASEAEREARSAREELDEIQAEIQFRVSAEATGQRQRIGSVNAVRHIITTEFEATAVPDGVDEPDGGSMVFVTELWQTADVPTADAMYEQWAQQLASDPALRAIAESMTPAAESGDEAVAEALSQWDPQVAAGILQLADAIATLEGTTVRIATGVALVPLGAELDRDELLAWQPASMGDQLRAGAGGAARQAASEAARGAVRGLSRGLPGRGNRDPEPEPAAVEAPVVRPLVRLTTSRDDIAYREWNEDVLGALNARIVDYRATTLQELKQQ